MINDLKKSADYIKEKIGVMPEIAIVLGTRLGYFADYLEDKKVIEYSDIPSFPIATAPDHEGKMIFGTLDGKKVLVMQGRIHYYEGYSMQEVAYPVWVMKFLGIKVLILTNAVGAINLDYKVGDIMMIEDHIKFFNDTPLTGKNIDEFGPRFNDMSDCYTKSIRTLAKKIAKEKNIDLKEGVYSYMPGPCFETPAEIKMLRSLGADVVGMSTVPEAIAAAHCGMKIFGLSFCTNMAAGILTKINDLELTDKCKKNFDETVRSLVGRLEL